MGGRGYRRLHHAGQFAFAARMSRPRSAAASRASTGATKARSCRSSGRASSLAPIPIRTSLRAIRCCRIRTASATGISSFPGARSTCRAIVTTNRCRCMATAGSARGKSRRRSRRACGSRSIGSDGKPYSYRAAQTYRLDGATLVVTLDVENTGGDALPFGLGLHPFLMREADTELSAAAGGVWLCGDDWLPVRHVPAPPAWQFGVAYPMPSTMVNNAFTGWSGRTSVMWPKRRLSLTISAEHRLLRALRAAGRGLFSASSRSIIRSMR